MGRDGVCYKTACSRKHQGCVIAQSLESTENQEGTGNRVQPCSLMQIGNWEQGLKVRSWQKQHRIKNNSQIQMANKHTKRCSTLLIIREMQIKITMMYHLTSVRMSIIKKSANKCWRGCGEKGALLHCWWECKLVQPLWKDRCCVCIYTHTMDYYSVIKKNEIMQQHGWT